MAVLNMKQEYTPSGDEPVEDEVNPATAEEVTPEESSTSNEEQPEASEDTESKTEEKVAEPVPVQEPEIKPEDKKINALRDEEERLRKQISELRTERRQVREEKRPDLLVKDDELKDVNTEDVALIEKVLRAKGYVRKEEITTMSYQEKMNSFKDDWLKAHPEYLPENDKEDVKWNALNSTVNAYFKAPARPQDVVKMLDMAHSMVAPSNPLPVKTRATVEASREKMQTSSKASSGGSSKPSNVKTNSLRMDALKGFSEEDIKEIFG